MRVKIEISVSPEGFGSANLLAREANIGVPELVDFSPGERLSADDVGLLTRKLMDAVASTVAGVRDDLLILMELARNADGGDRAHRGRELARCAGACDLCASRRYAGRCRA